MRSTLNEKFIAASDQLNHELRSLASPRSGEILMKKYITNSGEIINNHLKIPVYPLLNETEKMEMKKNVVNSIKFLKKKFEKWKGADIKKTRQSYSRIIISFQETFPEMRITGHELIRLSIPIAAVKKKDETAVLLGIGELKEEESKPKLINDKDNTEISAGKVEEKAPEIIVKKSVENFSSKKSNIIPISEAGKNLGEKVVLHLKSGRTLKGLIKSVDKSYFYLEISFKGGEFTGKFAIHDIDKIVKVLEQNSFYLIEE